LLHGWVRNVQVNRASTMTGFSIRTMARRLATTVAAAAAVLSSSAASAQPGSNVDWDSIIVGLDRYARTGSDKPASPKPAQPAPKPVGAEDPSPQNLGNAWFGVAPRVTLVARDWASSTRLAGDRLSLVDAMRLSASTRMVVGRARLSATRFTPFVQIGIGQWRVDRNYLPLTPHSIEVASQLGSGFELRLTRGWQVAAETTVTTLIRYGQSNTLPQNMLWSVFLASRIEL
jgi:hypothetical protein